MIGCTGQKRAEQTPQSDVMYITSVYLYTYIICIIIGMYIYIYYILSGIMLKQQTDLKWILTNWNSRWLFKNVNIANKKQIHIKYTFYVWALQVWTLVFLYKYNIIFSNENLIFIEKTAHSTMMYKCLRFF